jgi:hypothetical protein|tara:strand:+ start:343 stop:687 length:345 start_codon:yes stop_codon:yes gene_type:complete
MSDSHEIDYGNLIKVIQFKETDKRHADLRIRLHYDGFYQGEFFRDIVTGYLSGDENLIAYVEKVKEEKKKYNKGRLKKGKSLSESGKEAERQFALEDEEIESIFDIIKQEHPDL